MLTATSADYAPWHLVRADEKKRARLNCLSHFLSQIPYDELPLAQIKLGKRNTKATRALAAFTASMHSCRVTCCQGRSKRKDSSQLQWACVQRLRPRGQ
jgi:hypothetical protein